MKPILFTSERADRAVVRYSGFFDDLTNTTAVCKERESAAISKNTPGIAKVVDPD